MKVLAAGNALVPTLGAGPNTGVAQAIVVEGGGADPETYASIAALVTASEGSLAAGYYQVTAGVPVTHPQYPRVLTYWDGATFEPQISTGFEDRPDTTSEVWVWDALEDRFRRKIADGTLYHGSTTFGSGAVALVNSTYTNASTNPVFAVSDIAVGNVNTQFRAQNHGLGAEPSCTLIFVGTSSVAAGTYAIGLSIGINNVDRWLTLGPTLGAVHTWGLTYFGSEQSFARTPRAGGDILIVTYDEAAGLVTAWLNNEKFGPYSKPLSLGSEVSFCNSITGAQGVDSTNVNFARVSGNVFDDAAAAAWTAWLQTRYSIPVL